MEAKKTPPPKCETLDQDLTSIEMEELQDYEVVELCNENGDHKLFMLTTRFKGIKGRSKECKVQRMCFACSSKNYCRHGGSHKEEGRNFGKSGSSPIVHNA
jgi:hypothetical protein